eukprot:12124214-Heterocapsa_arctica.AAC.1
MNNVLWAVLVCVAGCIAIISWKRHQRTVREGTVWGGGDHNTYNEPWLDKSSETCSGEPPDRTLGNHTNL